MGGLRPTSVVSRGGRVDPRRSAPPADPRLSPRGDSTRPAPPGRATSPPAPWASLVVMRDRTSHAAHGRGPELVVLGTEGAAGPRRVDVIAVERPGRLTIIEVKLARRDNTTSKVAEAVLATITAEIRGAGRRSQELTTPPMVP